MPPRSSVGQPIFPYAVRNEQVGATGQQDHAMPGRPMRVASTSNRAGKLVRGRIGTHAWPNRTRGRGAMEVMTERQDGALLVRVCGRSMAPMLPRSTMR